MRWRVGDEVLAEYNINEYHDAVVEKLGAAMIFVRFVANGHHIMVNENQIREKTPLHPDFEAGVEPNSGDLYYRNVKTGVRLSTRPGNEVKNRTGNEEANELEQHMEKMTLEPGLKGTESFTQDSSSSEVRSDQYEAAQPQQEVTSAWMPGSISIPGLGWGRYRGSFRLPLPGMGLPCGCGRPGC